MVDLRSMLYKWTWILMHWYVCSGGVQVPVWGELADVQGEELCTQRARIYHEAPDSRWGSRPESVLTYIQNWSLLLISETNLMISSGPHIQENFFLHLHLYIYKWKSISHFELTITIRPWFQDLTKNKQPKRFFIYKNRARKLLCKVSW